VNEGFFYGRASIDTRVSRVNLKAPLSSTFGNTPGSFKVCTRYDIGGGV
jgi:hypothetical protein